MARGIAARLLEAAAEVEVRDVGARKPLTGDVIVLATTFETALTIAEKHADELSGKVVIDVTNPVKGSDVERVVTPPESSAAEEIAKRVPRAIVVKAFNTTFGATLLDGEVAGQQLDVFLAADDSCAKEEVRRLIEAAGMRVIDAGPLRRSRQLEQLGILHLALQDTLGTDCRSALKVLVP
jgi:predicted dinucleotide-binding enzyme